jgi:hypothetical protein
MTIKIDCLYLRFSVAAIGAETDATHFPYRSAKGPGLVTSDILCAYGSSRGIRPGRDPNVRMSAGPIRLTRSGVMTDNSGAGNDGVWRQACDERRASKREATRNSQRVRHLGDSCAG